MPKALTEAQVAQYRAQGYHFPIRVFSEAEAAAMRRGFHTLEAHDGGQLSRRTNTRSHLLLPWINQTIRDPRVLDAVEDVIGPDILCWASGFFAKKPGDGTFISWHQDATYWGLSSNDVVTAWVALSPSTPQSGCMRVVPGTHHRQVAHADTYGQGNLLSRGQEIAVEVDEAQAVDIVLAPGEMSLHHVLIFHGSNPNHAGDARIGLAIRYVPTHLKQLAPVKDTATLVRGTDRYGHFELEPAPKADFDPDAVAYHQMVADRHVAMLIPGEGKPAAAM